jgi:hypothetical protein
VAATIEPEPGEEERQAILAALAEAAGAASGWAEAALREGVDPGDADA